MLRATTAALSVLSKLPTTKVSERRDAALSGGDKSTSPAEGKIPEMAHLDVMHSTDRINCDSLEFDAEFYLAENSDVREADIDPHAHYLADGRREGRAPNASVKRRAYTMDMEDLCVIDREEGRLAIHDAEFFVSIVTPTYNTDTSFLTQLGFSVRNQIYDNWEWILVDDGSTRAGTHDCLRELERSDPRIRVILVEKNAGISAASNIAVQNARGTHIALVDHDDLLSRHALSSIYDHWRPNRDFDIFYTDECKLMPDGALGWFWGKPGWSPAYLENTMYLGHLVVYRHEFMKRLGGFRSEFDGTQDYDLALRAILHNPSVCHVPVFSYIWRASEGSTALNVNEKYYTLERQKKAVAGYAAARNPHASVLAGDAPGYWRVCYPSPKDPPRLTYLVYDAGFHRADNSSSDPATDCIRALVEAEFYSNAQFVVLTSNRSDQEKALGRQIAGKPAELVSFEPAGPALYEKLNDLALRCEGDFLCIIDRNVRVITERGGEEIISYMANNPEVGTVSPVFLEQNRIWQNGTIMLRSGPARGAAGQNRLFGGPNNLLRCRRETLAGGDGLLFVSCTNFRRLGGFDASLRGTACELEFSLRVQRAGLSCLVDPFVEVYRYDCRDGARPSADAADLARVEIFSDFEDPYFSKWYDQTRPDFQIRLNQYNSQSSQ